MKKTIFFFLFFLPLFCFSQINDDFSDGDFTHNPAWSGDVGKFIVESGVLRLNAPAETGTAYLSTPSTAIKDATWEWWVKLEFAPSTSNYARFYLVSSSPNLAGSLNGYLVRIGYGTGENKELSLYKQNGTSLTKIVGSTNIFAGLNEVEAKIRVTRNSEGEWRLFAQLAGETGYTEIGESAIDNTYTNSYCIGVLCNYTTTRRTSFYFDDIIVTGDMHPDTIPPILNDIEIIQPNQLILGFSEPLDETLATSVNNYILYPDEINPSSANISSGKDIITLTFASDIEENKLYTLHVEGLADESGNYMNPVDWRFGIPLYPEEADLVWNEVMFNNPESSVEYVEICNRSDKLIDASGLTFSTLRADGSLNTAVVIPNKTYIEPHGYAAFCSDAELLRQYYHLSQDANIYTTARWNSLNNESATLVLTDENNEIIYDQFTYSSKWHHPLVKNAAGVSLEKINPNMPTQSQESWHSASSEVDYGTPGYRNSQYRELESDVTKDNVWIEPEYFSPDNDGVLDVCFIRYATEHVGSVANAIIFNAVGEKVYRLYSDALLSSEGYIIWDGKTDSGKLANSGVYVLYLQLFNPSTGKKSEFKLPIVVSAK